MDSELIDCHCRFIIESQQYLDRDLGAKCTMGTAQCCWCSDKRIRRTIYIDGYGMLEPLKHYYQMPRDLYYCAICKHPDTISVGLFTEELKKCLPKPDIFHGRLTKEKKQIQINHTERMKKIEEVERLKKEHERRKEYKTYMEELNSKYRPVN